MKKSDLKQILKEEISNILTEIGEGTKPYPYDLIDQSDSRDAELIDEYVFEFYTDLHRLYTVQIAHDKVLKHVDVEFSVQTETGKWTSSGTFTDGLEETFKVMTTITTIVKKEFLDKFDIDKVIFTANTGKRSKGAQSKLGSKQRMNLYAQYIKKAFPNSKYSTEGDYHIFTLK